MKKLYTVNIAIYALAIILRVVPVWAAPLWYDEAFTYLVGRLSPAGIIAATAGDVHPPLFYFLIAPLARLGIPWLIRVPSILASIASLFFWQRILQRKNFLQSETIGLFLLAVTPFHWYYAQEGRMYALLELVVLAGYYAVITRRWGWVWICSTVALWLHNYGLFYVPALWLAGMVLDRQNWKQITLACGLAGLAWVPWLIVLLGQMGNLSAGYWIQPVNLGSVGYALYSLVWPFVLPQWASLAGMYILFSLLFFSVADGWWKGRWDMFIMALFPLALAVLGSMLWKPILLFRGLAGSAPFLLVPFIQAMGLGGKARRFTMPVLVPFILLGVYSVAQMTSIKGPVGLDVLDTVPAGETLVHTTDGTWIGMVANYPDRYNHVFLELPGHTDGQLSPATRAALGYQYTTQPAGWVLITFNPLMDDTLYAASNDLKAQASQLVKSDDDNRLRVTNNTVLYIESGE